MDRMFGLGLLLAVPLTAAETTWRRTDDSLALLGADGAAIWQFNHAASQATPYFHPLALPGGPPLTWVAPPDHPWHYGLWFAWKYLNGRNYWDFDRRTGKWDGVVKWSEVQVTPRDDRSARIALALVYRPADKDEPVLREQRRIDISAPDADGGHALDWSATFTAGDAPVVFDRTPIVGEPKGVPWGGYAGLTWRCAKDLKEPQAVSAAGLRDMQAHGQPASGCDLSGLLGGRAMGLAMVEHPANRVTPTPWYLAFDLRTPFLCLKSAPLFRASLTLPARESFTLRYRVLVHRERWDAARVKAAAEGFAR